MSELSLLRAQIIAIKPNSKAPIGTWHASNAETTAEMEALMPAGNRAIVLGHRFVALDVEGPGKRVSGEQHLAHLQSVLGNLPYTVSWKTPSGGTGYLFRSSGERHCDLSGTLGIELRAGAHYCLLPPSKYHSDAYTGEYRWLTAPSDVLTDDELPELPADWRDWFAEQGQAKLKEVRLENNIYFHPEWRTVIDQDLPNLDPDVGYHDWWKIAAVCHRAGCMDTFESWSRKGSKWDAQAENFCQNADKIFMPRMFTKEMVGIQTFLDIVPETKLRLLKPKGKDPVVDDTNERLRSMLLRVPLDGIARLISDDVAASMPEPFEYRYLAPLCVLSTMAQRRITVPNTSAMNYHLLAGGAGSRKSALQHAIKDLVTQITPTAVINKPASVQALVKCFGTNPSRFLAVDEGIERLISIYSPKAINTPLQETFAGMLEYFGSPLMVSGQENKKEEDSQKGTLSPRLTFLLGGVTEQFADLCGIDKFISSGMASRLAPWVVESPQEGFDSWWAHETRGVTWTKTTTDALRDRWGMYLCSSNAHPTWTKLKLAQGCKEAFQPFFVEMDNGRKAYPEQDSIYLRMRERAIWYAALHAYGCMRSEVTVGDLEIGMTLCRYHCAVWRYVMDEKATDDIGACAEGMLAWAVKHGGVMTRYDIHHRVPRRFKGAANYRLRMLALDALLDSSRLMQIGKSYKIP
jgi:hypothetical protein